MLYKEAIAGGPCQTSGSPTLKQHNHSQLLRCNGNYEYHTQKTDAPDQAKRQCSEHKLQ